MKKLLLIITTVIAVSCGNKEGKKEEVRKEEIFPVTSFIEGQIHLVDSFQSLTMRYNTVNDKTDTTLISVAEFKHIAQEFLQPDFNAAATTNKYKENSFADQSMNGVAFNYTTEDPGLEIQRVDVVVDASAVSNDKVRSIYMEKQNKVQDTFVYKKLYWRTDRNLQIITSKRLIDKPEVVTITRVEWSN